MKKALIALILITLAGAAYASTYGKLFDALLVSQRAGGVTLASGKAYFYSPGTTNAKTVYTDYNKTTPASQPVTLSADGTAAVYGDGLYDVKLTNSAGTQKAYWYNVTLSLDVDYATAAGTATSTSGNAATATLATDATRAYNSLRLGGYSSSKFARYSSPSTRLKWSDNPLYRGAMVVANTDINYVQNIPNNTEISAYFLSANYDTGNYFSGGSTVNFTVTIANPAVFTATEHGLSDGAPLNFTTTGALPTGLTGAVTTTYYVVNKTTNTFNVAATYGGAAIETTGTQSGTHSYIKPSANLTIPSGVSKVRLTGGVGIASTSGVRRVSIYHYNSSDAFVYPVYVNMSPATASIYGDNVTTPVLTVSPGDYFRLKVYHNNGSAINMYGLGQYFGIEIIE